jgi:hypothetical protein
MPLGRSRHDVLDIESSRLRESDESSAVLQLQASAGRRRNVNSSQGERHRSRSSRPPRTTHPSRPVRRAVATDTSRRLSCVEPGSAGNAPSPDRRRGGGYSTRSMDSSCRTWQVALDARPTLCIPTTGIEPVCLTAYVRARTARAPLARAASRRQRLARRYATGSVSGPGRSYSAGRSRGDRSAGSRSASQAIASVRAAA